MKRQRSWLPAHESWPCYLQRPRGPAASEQLVFGYDGGWNITGRAVNGSPTNYTVNDLNEVTSVGGTPCTYDQNGNRLTYGQGSGTTTYEYDDENRLTRVTTRNGSPLRSDFTYDGLGRLRLRAEYTWYYNQWSLASTTRYIYDGKRVIQERNENNTPLVSYTRGKDLSGSLEGAGGIGGLLARSHGYSGGAWSAHNFYHADALGNVTYMINSAQSMVASYKYDPYGRTIGSSGSLSAANLYRFSSKELHVNSGFYYYLHRFYDPNTQRWLNRDPLADLGSIAFAGHSFRNSYVRLRPTAHWTRAPFESYSGANVFRFLENDPTEVVDVDGTNASNLQSLLCAAAAGAACNPLWYLKKVPFAAILFSACYQQFYNMCMNNDNPPNPLNYLKFLPQPYPHPVWTPPCDYNAPPPYVQGPPLSPSPPTPPIMNPR